MNDLDVKKIITSQFDKFKFELIDCNRDRDLDGKWECVDEYIRPFIKELNKNKNISTDCSCEGHHFTDIEHEVNDFPYLYFHVDEEGWNLFWIKVLPEMLFLFGQAVKMPDYIPECPNTHPYYTLSWNLSIMSDGISIYGDLSNEIILWGEKKKRFWEIMTETFLKYFL